MINCWLLLINQWYIQYVQSYLNRCTLIFSCLFRFHSDAFHINLETVSNLPFNSLNFKLNGLKKFHTNKIKNKLMSARCYLEFWLFLVFVRPKPLGFLCTTAVKSLFLSLFNFLEKIWFFFIPYLKDLKWLFLEETH